MIEKILVYGAGYVGSSLSVLLAQNYEVAVIDTDNKKVAEINNKKAPIQEPLMQDFFDNKALRLVAFESLDNQLNTFDLIIISLPTNYNEEVDCFDTSILESVLSKFNQVNFMGIVVIKSTIPIGFTSKMKKMYPNLSIAFVPEFLREGKAMIDNIQPSRIVVGCDGDGAEVVANVFLSIAKNFPEVFYMSSMEAEAVKLFANSYLATRISFFNELDSFAIENNLNTKNIIDGVASDVRIGEGYHNPSFGYGGYCLPKDTKQLLTNFKDIPQEIFSAVVKSNDLRKNFIAQKVLSINPKTVGIFRLVMKKDSHNFRESSIYDVMEILNQADIDLIVYEPLLPEDHAEFKVINDLYDFKKHSEIILANRMDDLLTDVAEKVFTRDVYCEN
jgi:UDPglucose 6-dehydrogenase